MQLLRISAYLEIGVPTSLYKEGTPKHIIPEIVLNNFLANIDSIGTSKVYEVDGSVCLIPINDSVQESINDGTTRNANMYVFQSSEGKYLCVRGEDTTIEELKGYMLGKRLNFTYRYKGEDIVIVMRIGSIEMLKPRQPKRTIKPLLIAG
jgi:protein involved in sex pheromone biosynthesis